MRAFEVFLNGERLCVAGIGNDGVLTTIIDYVVNHGQRLHLHVGGLLLPEGEHVRWVGRPLRIGDKVEVKIVECDTVNKPRKRFPRDPKREIKSQKRYVRNIAKKFGWTIETHSKSK